MENLYYRYGHIATQVECEKGHVRKSDKVPSQVISLCSFVLQSIANKYSFQLFYSDNKLWCACIV